MKFTLLEILCHMATIADLGLGSLTEPTPSSILRVAYSYLWELFNGAWDVEVSFWVNTSTQSLLWHCVLQGLLERSEKCCQNGRPPSSILVVWLVNLSKTHIGIEVLMHSDTVLASISINISCHEVPRIWTTVNVFTKYRCKSKPLYHFGSDFGLPLLR